MAETFDLSFRIRALVEGIRQVQSFRQEIGRLTRGLLQLAGIGSATAFLSQSIQQIRQAEASMRGLASIANFVGLTFEEVNAQANELSEDGLLSAAEASRALQNLLSRGYDVDQAVQTINRLKDAAAFNRAAHLSLGQAVVTATQGLKNENSILVDNAGVTKNVSILWKEYAEEIGKTVGKLSQAEKVQAEVNGILRETAGQVGNAAKAAEGIEGRIAAWEKANKNLKTSLGDALIPALTNLATAGTWLLNNVISPLLTQVRALGITIGFLIESTKDIFTGNFDQLAGNWRRANEMIRQMTIDARKGALSVQEEIKNNIDQAAIEARRQRREEKERIKALEERLELEEKRFELVEARAEREAELIKASAQEQNRVLEDRFRRELVAFSAYYAQRQVLQERGINAEVSATNRQLQAQQSLLSQQKKEEERIPILAKIERLQTQLALLEKERAAVAGKAARAQAQAERELENELEQVRVRLLQVQGQTAEAATARLEAEYRELIARLKVEGDEEGQEIVRRLINLQGARAELSELETTFRQTMEAMSLQEQRIQVDRKAGLISESQARKQIIDLHRQTQAELDELIPRMREMAEPLGEEAELQVDQFAQRIRELGLVTNQTAARIRATAQDEVGGLFDDLTDGIGKASDAMEDFANDFLHAVRRIIIDSAVQELFALFPRGRGGGSESGIVGLLTGLFHQGGVAGEAAPKRRVSPLLFGQAPRYQTGGVAGLQPDEVPAILHRGEEVLTREDPRHRQNQRQQTQPVVLQVSPDTMGLTLREWFEGYLASEWSQR